MGSSIQATMQELPEVWITITPDPRLGCYWVMIGCAQNTERFNLINEDAAELIRGACLKTVDAAELVRLIRDSGVLPLEE